MKQRGQGAIEYLLLLAAAIVVVAIVISFLGTITPTVAGQGNKQLYDNICGEKAILSLDKNSLLCGCYLKNAKLGEKNSSGQYVMASVANCPEKLPTQYADDPLLDWK